MPCVPPKRGRKRKGGALFLIAEDSLAKTVRGRLLAAGADLTKIGVLENVVIPDDLMRAEKAIAEIDARLVVVDTFAIVVDSKSVKAAFQSIGGTMEAVQNAAGAYGVGCTRWKAFSTIDPVLILGFSRWPAVQDRREPSDGQRIFPQTRKQSKRQPQPVLTAGQQFPAENCFGPWPARREQLGRCHGGLAGRT
jgi:hypothetical protein